MMDSFLVPSPLDFGPLFKLKRIDFILLLATMNNLKGAKTWKHCFIKLLEFNQRSYNSVMGKPCF